MRESRGVALVTGASRGIGKATCLHLALAGFDLIAAARSVEAEPGRRWPGTLDETCAMVRELGREALPVRCDLAELDQVRALYEQAMARFGRIDVLVNNALYYGRAAMARFDGVAWEAVDKLLRVNLHAPLFLAQLAAPQMARQGGGTIVNLTSGSARHDSAGMPGEGSPSVFYALSKAAIDRLGVGLARELRPRNIAVLTIDPGSTLTEQRTADTHELGFDLSDTQSVHVTARAIAWLVTCPDPNVFTGQITVARTLVAEHFLLEPAELESPWRPGQTYDPYAEPVWRRLLRIRQTSV